MILLNDTTYLLTQELSITSTHLVTCLPSNILTFSYTHITTYLHNYILA